MQSSHASAPSSTSSKPTRWRSSDPQALAWTFNIRGADVAHTPLPLAFAIIPQDGRSTLYVDGRKLTQRGARDARGLADVREPERFVRDLAALGRRAQDHPPRSGNRRRRDRPQSIVDAGGKISRGPDPIALMKAVKNEAEIGGARAAHLRDGAAMTRFLAWFDREAPHGRLTEIDAVEALEAFRARDRAC